MSDRIDKSHCNSCGGLRNHNILYAENITDTEELDDHKILRWWDSYELLKCCGCERISMRHRHAFSENMDDDGNPTTNTNYYPPSLFRKKPKWCRDLSWILNFSIDPLKELLEEIYICLQNDAPRLAIMGVRALIEHIMIDKIDDNGNFKKNIAKFEAEGYISKKQKEVIESTLELGHAAMHRSYKPTSDVISDALDILENIIEIIYVNPARQARISNKTPSKKHSAKNPTT